MSTYITSLASITSITTSSSTVTHLFVTTAIIGRISTKTVNISGNSVDVAYKYVTITTSSKSIQRLFFHSYLKTPFSSLSRCNVGGVGYVGDVGDVGECSNSDWR